MDIFQENIQKYEIKLLKLSNLLKRISFIRLLIFIVLIILLIFLFKFKLLTTILIVFPLISIFAFGAALRYYSKVFFQRRHSEFLKQINESEILRENCKLELFDPGDRFINQHHSYTSDLDIFGQHSIFQLINRTTTESGSKLLSQWLSEPADKTEITHRQQAVIELSQSLDWRQEFQALGMHYQNKRSDYNKLLDWIESPSFLINNRFKYIVVSIVLATLSLLGLYFSAINLVSENRYNYLVPFILVLIVNYLLLRKVRTIAEDIVKVSQENIDILKSYRKLINKIETETFKSAKLKQLQSKLLDKPYSAFNEINKLCRLLDFSQQRGVNRIKLIIKGNPFYSFLNSFLLLDIYLIIGVENWKLKNNAHLESWTAVVSEFEVLNSIAGYSYLNPTYTFPEITEKKNYVHFDQLGHPLIPSDKRVCNNFHSERHGDVVMITGSNMGGKSTFLRTIGVNIVLALAGAPCCAKYGLVSNLQLYTSLRTQDNLKEGISSFYAELDRIGRMLKLIENNQNIFFLLDEMFKGTNSEDRHKGGFSLINQISKLNTSGIIATHDIDLAKLVETKRLATNYSFNSEIINDAMIFSYKLHHGICNDFNASELMKRSGIKVLSKIPEN